MATIVTMPQLGLTMTEGTILKWFKKAGEPVKAGEVLLEVNSDKSAVEIEANASGILRRIMVAEGSTVPVQTPIAIIGAADEPLPDPGLPAEEAKLPEPEANAMPAISLPAAASVAEGKPPARKASPAARKKAAELGVDLAEITETKHADRIESQDVIDYYERNKVKATPMAVKLAAEKGIDLKTVAVEPGRRIGKEDVARAGGGTAAEEHILCTGMRKVIAERMSFSKNTIPHMYLAAQADMTNALELKERLAPVVEQKYRVKLSLNAILIKAVAAALRDNPGINSSFAGGKIIRKKEVNVGLAVAVDKGLIVPVVKQADARSIGEVALELAELIDKARQGKLAPAEYSDGTFTVSNLGMYETDWVIPIINPPESAILGVGRIVKTPVVIGENIAARPMMNLILSCDHRVTDGAEAAVFLRMVKKLLEEPLGLFV